MSGTSTARARSRQTDEVMDTVCASLRLGIPFNRSCRAAGIGDRTGREWRQVGWRSIEEADPSSDEPLSFTARFAIEVEAALVEFMAPLVERVRDAAAGRGKGDWRAAQQLLAARFPDEFSERTHVAKSQRVEVAGSIGINTHGFEEFVALRKMSFAELRAATEKIQAQIDNDPITGKNLDDEISFLEAKLAAMRDERATTGSFTPGNWLTLSSARRPIAIDLEDREFTEAAPLAIGLEAAPSGDGLVHAGSTPIAAGAASVVRVAPADLPEAAPRLARVQTGIGYDAATGLAIPMFAGDDDETKL